MPTARRLRDSGFVDPRTLPRGPHGRASCRWCATEVPPRRRTFCSDACVHEWRLRSDPGYARRAVERRDGGVCAGCGLDTGALERSLRRALAALTGQVEWTRTHRTWEDGAQVTRFRRPLRRALRARGARPALRALDALKLSLDRSFWEADHVVAVVEGGGLCGLDNLRTLCRACHRLATRALRARRVGAPIIFPSPQPLSQRERGSDPPAPLSLGERGWG